MGKAKMTVRFHSKNAGEETLKHIARVFVEARKEKESGGKPAKGGGGE